MNVQQKKKRRGRPTKLPAIDLRQVEALGQYGLTQEEIASVIGIATSTLYEYRKQDPDFSEAIKKGRARADAKVIQSLYNRAIGRRVTSKETPKGIVEVIQFIDPDVTACIFWMKNRQPDRWKDKHDVEHSGGVAGSGQVVFIMPRPGQKPEPKARPRAKGRK